MLSSSLLDALMSTIRKTPPGRKRAVDVGQHARRLGLVVYRVERGDDVVRVDCVELRDIACDRTTHSQGPIGPLRARPTARPSSEKSIPVNRLAGKRLGHHVDGMSTAATEVGNLRARTQLVGQTVGHAGG